MLTTLHNDQLTVTADTRGAELQTIDGADGTRYLWEGDPAYWSGRAPNLFPIVGALRGGRATSREGEVRLERHGFARKAAFTVEAADDTHVTFRLQDDGETRKQYPYAFCLRVCYELEGSTLRTVYRVSNPGDKPMPFCVGGHPAFRVPLTPGETYEDYTITFDEPETADCPQILLDSGLIDDGRRNRLITESRSFSLNHILFRGDALVFDRLRSRGVCLASRVSGRGVRMDFDGLDYFAVWSPFHDSPFVCLEPWSGTATQTSEDDVFEHKQGMRTLAPGEEAVYAFTVTVF